MEGKCIRELNWQEFHPLYLLHPFYVHWNVHTISHQCCEILFVLWKWVLWMRSVAGHSDLLHVGCVTVWLGCALVCLKILYQEAFIYANPHPWRSPGRNLGKVRIRNRRKISHRRGTSDPIWEDNHHWPISHPKSLWFMAAIAYWRS